MRKVKASILICLLVAIVVAAHGFCQDTSAYLTSTATAVNTFQISNSRRRNYTLKYFVDYNNTKYAFASSENVGNTAISSGLRIVASDDDPLIRQAHGLDVGYLTVNGTRIERGESFNFDPTVTTAVEVHFVPHVYSVRYILDDMEQTAAQLQANYNVVATNDATITENYTVFDFIRTPLKLSFTTPWLGRTLTGVPTDIELSRKGDDAAYISGWYDDAANHIVGDEDWNPTNLIVRVTYTCKTTNNIASSWCNSYTPTNNRLTFAMLENREARDVVLRGVWANES